MSSFQITFKPSLEQLGRKFRSIGIPNFLRDEIKRLAFDTEREAKLETPVDKGGLRSSISTSLSIPMGAVVRPHVPYAGWIHEGWMNRGGKRIFIRGGGRGSTPSGGKPYMLLGVTKALKGFETRLSRRLGRRIKAKITRI